MFLSKRIKGTGVTALPFSRSLYVCKSRLKKIFCKLFVSNYAPGLSSFWSRAKRWGGLLWRVGREGALQEGKWGYALRGTVFVARPKDSNRMGKRFHPGKQKVFDARRDGFQSAGKGLLASEGAISCAKAGGAEGADKRKRRREEATREGRFLSSSRLF